MSDKVDPARFIVRREAYQQIEGFPEACAQLTEELITHRPDSLTSAYAFVSQHIQHSPILNRDWAAQKRKGFGTPREGILHTHMSHEKYIADSNEAATLYNNHPDNRITYANPSATNFLADSDIALSRIYIDTTDPKQSATYTIEHPTIGEDADYMDAHRWGVISQKYKAALDTKQSDADRKKASIECYALLSHDCPDKRGSATLARILLEFLAHEASFTIPLTKPEVDLNTKTLLRTPDTFVQEWDRGEYFDTAVSSQAVMDWHKQKLIPSQSLAH